MALNLVGNVAAFLPFGFFLPAISQKARRFHYTALASLAFSLLIECIQLFLRVGCFDVDDLMLNTLGGILGFLCFLVARGWKGKHGKKEKRQKKL